MGEPSSRLIVKNLPKVITEVKLRDLFAKKGNVTDVQLKFGPDGKFRRFAFVGFKSVAEAEEARVYYNKTFVGATKIYVENCFALGDVNKPRAWSKLSAEKVERKNEDQGRNSNSEDGVPIKRKKVEEEILEKCQEDPNFAEFLQAHRKQAAWTNETIFDELEAAVDGKKKLKKAKDKDDANTSLPDEPISDSPSKKKADHNNDFFTVKLRDLPRKAKKKDIKNFFAPITPKSIRVPPTFRGIAYVGFEAEKDYKAAVAKNRSIMLGKKITVTNYELHRRTEQNVDAKKSRWDNQAKDLEKEAETVDETGRLFVRNLPYTATEADMKELFEKFGPVTEVNLPLDRLTRQIKGFGFVSFLLPEHATTAFKELDGSAFQGRMLHLLPSKSKSDEVSTDPNAGSSFKRERDIKKKKSAGSSYNWNTLFLGQNAVAEVAVAKYGISREELLLDSNADDKDDNQPSAAVRLALAETEIVDETKRFLEKNGVQLTAFDNAKPERSRNVILVKNLPSQTTAIELKELFSKYGQLGRVVLPPSGITAILEFMEPAEARLAFSKYAYTKFKGMPMYLEWAPVETFKKAYIAPLLSLDVKKEDASSPAAQAMKEENIDKTETKEPKPETVSSTPTPGGSKNASSTKILVKNIPFLATVEEITTLFRTFGKLNAVRLPLKSDGSNGHRGFGFIDFVTKKDAETAFETMCKSTHLYGRRLVLEWAAVEESVEELREKTAKNFDRQSAVDKSVTKSTKAGLRRYFDKLSTKKSNTSGHGIGDDEDDI